MAATTTLLTRTRFRLFQESKMFPKLYMLIDNFKLFWDVVLFSFQQIGQLPGGRRPVIGITLLQF